MNPKINWNISREQMLNKLSSLSARNSGWADDVYEFANWLAGHVYFDAPTKGPDLDEMWGILTSIVDEQVDRSGCDYVELDRTDVDDLLTALAPYFYTPNCIFCDYKGKNLKQHSSVCKKHPLYIENERLQGVLRMACIAESDRTAERNALRDEVASVKADRDTYKTRVAELEAIGEKQCQWNKELSDTAGKLETENIALSAELKAVTAERDAVQSTFAEVNNAYHEAHKTRFALQQELAAIRQPIDADAWKTPLEISSAYIASDAKFWFESGDPGLVVVRDSNKKQASCTFTPTTAACAAQWLASYAAAHGCPVGLTAPVIDVPKGVLSVADLHQVGVAACLDSGMCFTINYERHWHQYVATIRDAVLAGLGQTTHAAPTDGEIEALARVLCGAWSALKWDDWNSLSKDKFRSEARAAFAHIGCVPVGAELDVTAEELARWHQGAKHDQSAIYEKFDDLGGNYKEDFIVAAESTLNYLRSRIRPVHECQECAETRKHYNDLGAIMKQVADLSRTAMEGE